VLSSRGRDTVHLVQILKKTAALDEHGNVLGNLKLFLHPATIIKSFHSTEYFIKIIEIRQSVKATENYRNVVVQVFETVYYT